MSSIEEISRILNELKSNMLQDAGDSLKPMVEAQFTNLEDALAQLDSDTTNLTQTTNTQDNSINQTGLGVHMSNLGEIHDLLTQRQQRGWGPKPLKNFTITPLLKELTNAPYYSTTDFFGGTIGGTVVIKTPYRTHVKAASEAVTQLFPGKISKRYGLGHTVFVPIGPYSQNMQCDLTRTHRFEEGVEETLNDIPVRRLKRLHCEGFDWVTEHPPHRYPVCRECLSLYIEDGPCAEMCEHLREVEVDTNGVQKHPNLTYVRKLNGLVDKKKIENHPDQRNISETQTELLPILDQVVEQISFVENLQVLTYARGFSREATIGAGSNSYKRSVFIEYNPHPGYITNTQSVILKLKPISDDFVNLITSNNVIVRDILIDIFAERILEIIEDDPFPQKRSVFDLDLILSGIIKALNLDQITNQFDWEQIVQTLNTDEFETNFHREITAERELSAGTLQNLAVDVISIYSREIRSLTITHDEISSKIRKLIINSIGNLAFLAAQVTSGSDQDELGFIVNENNEIIIYDTPEGGNGASRLVFQYLGGTPPAGALNSHFYLKPINFQEALLELLEPCSQGVTDRVSFQGLSDGFSNFNRQDLITYRFDDIERTRHLEEFQFLNNIVTIRNVFPVSIGKRALPNAQPTQTVTPPRVLENKKIQELSQICIHGCPECILLKNYQGLYLPHIEKYNVSKYLVDQFFKFCSNRITVSHNDDDDDIMKVIEDNQAVIISQTVDTMPFNFNDLLTKINSFVGYKINCNGQERVGKFTGIWLDCEIGDDPHLQACVSIGVI